MVAMGPQSISDIISVLRSNLVWPARGQPPPPTKILVGSRVPPSLSSAGHPRSGDPSLGLIMSTRPDVHLSWGTSLTKLTIPLPHSPARRRGRSIICHIASPDHPTRGGTRMARGPGPSGSCHTVRVACIVPQPLQIAIAMPASIVWTPRRDRTRRYLAPLRHEPDRKSVV